ncbi:MAG: coenzyme F420-0:L-glutamate ligase [Myxococcota bacterium]
MNETGREPETLDVGSKVSIVAVPGIPTIEHGDDLLEIVSDALRRAELRLTDGDVVVIASKVVSRAEGCFVDLSTVVPSESSRALAAEVDKDPRLVELIMSESDGISRKREGALIVRHRLGFVSANAGIDASNSAPRDTPEGTGPWVLTLPQDPDATAARMREHLEQQMGAAVGVVITDSWGRPFRRGTVGFALGASGVPPVVDRRGAHDRHGRELEATETAAADAIAAAADLVAGQADEGRPVTVVRGLRFTPSTESSRALLRDPDLDLYA